MATDEQVKALQYLKKKFKTKTAFELYRVVEKLSGIIRKESQKESVPNGKFTSQFSAEIPFEAEQLLNKDGK